MNENVLKELLARNITPAYVFDIHTLKKRIKYLKDKLPNKISLCYAIKANTFIVKDIENEVERFEVCSPGEYYICKESDLRSNKILISGVYKSKEFIEELINSDSEIERFSIESMEQFEIFKNVKSQKKIKLLIRITSGNQFGINKNDAEEIIKNRHEYKNIEIDGIQYFSGTQKISVKNIQRELNLIDEFIMDMKEKYEFETKEFEFGPGFPVFYFQNTEFEEDEFMSQFSDAINSIKFEGKIILEIGRGIVASCGAYLTKVVDKKKNKNQNYAILDGGMNHIVYYGQSMAMKVPKCRVFPTKENDNIEKWNLCGSLCTTNDILVKQLPVCDLQIGDVFIFENTGAYCMTEGISLFLSRDLPKIVKIMEDGSIDITRENIPTYKLNM